jgi:hypothetical protein
MTQCHLKVSDQPGTIVNFSAFRAMFLAVSDPNSRHLLTALAEHLLRHDGPVALHDGNLLAALLEESPALGTKVCAIIAPEGKVSADSAAPVVASASGLLPDTLIFLCESRTEPRWRMRGKIDGSYRVLCPDVLTTLDIDLPHACFVAPQKSRYPIDVPEIEIKPGLDVLLLDLPSRRNFFMPLGLGYVHKTLKKTPGITFQTFDADVVTYHRYHIRRIFDWGVTDIQLDTGQTLPANPWQGWEEYWPDPRYWPALYRLFGEDLTELAEKIIAARPRILAMSVHPRNEWSSRLFARHIKAALPEIVIVVGGHSCLHAQSAPFAFPEYDYIVAGEAELVFGDLVRALVRGERPADLPGIIGRWDSPGWQFQPAPLARDLDEIGAPDFDWFTDITVYKDHLGGIQPYVCLTRGCIWSRCTFCSERFSFRTRSAKNLVDELEWWVKTHGINSLCFSESDFGGKAAVLKSVAEEILSRGLKVELSGQLRINPLHDEAMLMTMAKAGINLNFGIDALTPNTLKLQQKGYSMEIVQKQLERCRRVGISVQINLVIGVPGETEDDIDQTIDFIRKNRDLIQVFGLSPFYLKQGSLYWDEPDKYGIKFYFCKDSLKQVFHTVIPDEFWYSTAPYIDGPIRSRRALRILKTLNEENIPYADFTITQMELRMFSDHERARDWTLIMSRLGFEQEFALQPQFTPGLPDQIENRTIIRTDQGFRAVEVPATTADSGQS